MAALNRLPPTPAQGVVLGLGSTSRDHVGRAKCSPIFLGFGVSKSDFNVVADRTSHDGQEIFHMKAIVVADQAAGTAGMKLAERPEPQAAINDVIVQIHASGF